MTLRRGTIRRTLLVGLAATVLLCAGLGGYAFWLSRHKKETRPLLVVISGDTNGWITPCGCAVSQLGGLLRRGTYLKDARDRGDVIYADAGGAPAGTSDYQRVKFEFILRGEMKLGLAAHNLGGGELALGSAYLRQLAHRTGVPFISANARDDQGKPLADPAIIIQSAGRRVALVGVVSPRFAKGDVKIDDPREAVMSAIAPLAGKYDCLVILAYLPDDELQQLASALPEAHAVIGGPTGQTIAPRQAGPTLLASATNKGKFLIELEQKPDADVRLAGRVVEMNDTLPDDARQLENLKCYLDELGQRDFRSDQTGLTSTISASRPADYAVAGSERCASCHDDDHVRWSWSRHGRAWDSLRRRKSQVDPGCQVCHTTSYGLPGGFVSVSQSVAMMGVGCESCHGPSLAHVRNVKVKTPFVARDQCLTCHDHENSPDFDYAKYWTKIDHGQQKAVAPATQPTGREVAP